MSPVCVRRLEVCEKPLWVPLWRPSKPGLEPLRPHEPEVVPGYESRRHRTISKLWQSRTLKHIWKLF